MKLLIATFASIFLASAALPALACACELDCKPGESYSDQAEMCVPDQTS
ncbi:MAG: hypothetical protein AAFQ44_01040 [Pseudomonadota bacterium]